MSGGSCDEAVKPKPLMGLYRFRQRVDRTSDAGNRTVKQMVRECVQVIVLVCVQTYLQVCMQPCMRVEFTCLQAIPCCIDMETQCS